MPKISVSFELHDQDLIDLEREGAKILIMTRNGWRAEASIGGRTIPLGAATHRVTGRKVKKSTKKAASSGKPRVPSLSTAEQRKWANYLKAAKQNSSEFYRVLDGLKAYSADSVRAVCKIVTGVAGASKKDAYARLSHWRAKST